MNKNRLSGIRKMLFALLAFPLLAACTQDELADRGVPLPEGKYPLELNVSGLEDIAVPSQASTRGIMDGDWKDRNIVAVEVFGEVKRYQAIPLSEDGKIAKLIAAEGETPFYWNSTNEDKVIYAWCPYSESRPNPYHGWAVKTDQHADEGKGFYESDLIGIDPLRINFADRNHINLQFKHQVAKVIVTIQRNYVSEQLEFKDATLTLSEFMNAGNKDIITARKIDATGMGNIACWEALVPPQDQILSFTFAINIPGYDPFIYRRESWRDLRIRSGTITKINITLKGTGIEISSIECEPWGDGEEAEGTTDEMVPKDKP